MSDRTKASTETLLHLLASHLDQVGRQLQLPDGPPGEPLIQCARALVEGDSTSAAKLWQEGVVELAVLEYSVSKAQCTLELAHRLQRLLSPKISFDAPASEDVAEEVKPAKPFRYPELAGAESSGRAVPPAPPNREEALDALQTAVDAMSEMSGLPVAELLQMLTDSQDLGSPSSPEEDPDQGPI